MTLSVKRLGFALGAEVTGVDLRRPLPDEVMKAVYQAWLDHMVLVFPGQDLSPAEQVAFSRRFGQLDRHASQLPEYLHPDFPEILTITTKPVGNKPSDTRQTGRSWHTDLTTTTRPAKGALLLCREKPPVGGDTMWANLCMGYETLSAPMRAFVETLEAVHDVALVKGIENRDPANIVELKRRNPPIVHPLVRVHPETGRKSLLVGQRISRFVGMTDEETRAILDYLNAHVTQPEFVYRHQWSVHDLVLWDNRCTQHVALADFDQSQGRLMTRCTLAGEETGRLAERTPAETPDSLARSIAALN